MITRVEFYNKNILLVNKYYNLIHPLYRLLYLFVDVDVDVD